MAFLLIGAALAGTAVAVQELTRPGEQSEFPLDANSVAKVQSKTMAYLARGRTSPEVHKLALLVLMRNGLTEQSGAQAKATVLHRYVADAVPFKEDPPGFERMESPDRMASKLLSGKNAVEDCDSLSPLLASLCISVGIPSSVSFLDTDDDGQIDHAMATLLIGGRVVYAETTKVGVPLGWRPPTKNPPQVLPLVS